MDIESLYGLYLSCGGRVTTDSRSIEGGEIFFALKGENFDGNDYALQALDKGACYAVADRAGLPDRDGLVKVEDSLKALTELATWHRAHVRGGELRVLGLTGTNGKTTTKNLIREVLSCRYDVCATEGNLNNDIGVPLTLLKIRPENDFAIVEMGANHPDDIEKLVKVCRPDCGLITNVGKAHLLGFGSFEGVKHAKGALYRWLAGRSGSIVFLNEDDADLRGMASSLPCHIFPYGVKYQGAEILPCDAEHPFLALRLGGDVIRTHFVGAYNAANVLAALAVGERFGVCRSDAIRAVESFVPANNRSQMMRGKRNSVIVDAYNANPSSMAAALDNFRAVISPRKVVMLGDMRELGADSLQEHVAVLERLISDGLEAYLVGEEFGRALAQVEAPSGWKWFGTSAQLASSLETEPVEGAMVLVKGSRGIQMEKVLPLL